jgi:hypothetical protein
VAHNPGKIIDAAVNKKNELVKGIEDYENASPEKKADIQGDLIGAGLTTSVKMGVTAGAGQFFGGAVGAVREVGDVEGALGMAGKKAIQGGKATEHVEHTLAGAVRTEKHGAQVVNVANHAGGEAAARRIAEEQAAHAAAEARRLAEKKAEREAKARLEREAQERLEREAAEAQERTAQATHGLARGRVLQRGGNTLSDSTATALNKEHDLNLPKREWGRALESLKRAEGRPPNFHGVIDSAGNVIDQNTGEIVGSLLDYVQH